MVVVEAAVLVLLIPVSNHNTVTSSRDFRKIFKNISER